MNRRHFIKNSSLTAASGLLMSQLPLHAALNSIIVERQVILCVTGGLSWQDFPKLFVNEEKNAIKRAGTFIENMEYKGFAASHRMAFESILHGRYIQETENGKKPLIKSPLFETTRGVSYLVSTNRFFLQDNDSSTSNAIHIYVGDKNRTIDSVDLLVAETASKILTEKKPALLVTHFMGADVAHGDIDVAEENIKHIANGIQRIWEAALLIQPNPENILFIVVPDFGRNANPNTIANSSGKFGYDHNISDENTRHISAFVSDVVFNSTENLKESTDILPLITQFLGSKIS